MVEKQDKVVEVLKSGGGGKWFKIPGGNVDTLTVDHNTAFMTSLIATTDTTPNASFTYTNNIAPHANYGFHSPTHTLNEATLGQYYPSAVWARNVIQGAASSSFLPNYHGGWNPTSLGYPSTWGTVLVNQATPGSNFAGWKVITSSAYDNGATDGLDVGVDIDALNAATAGCISGVWP